MAKVFSTEDGKLSGSVRVVTPREYSDIDLSFAARTISDGDIYRKLDVAAVKQSLKTLLLTNNFEKPYRPKFGANLGALLFSLADEDTGAEIADRIKKSLSRYEPRAELLSLSVSALPNNNSVSIRLEFRVVSTLQVDTLDVKVTQTTPGEIPIRPAPTVTPEVVPTAENVNFDDMILTQDLRAIKTTSSEQVLVRSYDVLPETTIIDGSILTQSGVMLLIQDGATPIIIQDQSQALTGNYIITLEDFILAAENGDYIVNDFVGETPENAVLLEDGSPLLYEDRTNVLY